MKILFLANLIPFPLDGGGKIFTYSTLEALSHNNEIDLLCFYEQEDIESAKKALIQYCQSVTALPIRVTTRENMSLMLKKAATSVFSLEPLAVTKYYTPAMRDTIKKLMQQNRYDCVFMNLLAMGVYAKEIYRNNPDIKIVLYEQNCEALIYKRLFVQEKSIIKKLFIGYEYIKLKRFEQKTIHSVDRVIVLSKEDEKNLGLTDAPVIPIGVQPQAYQKKYGENNPEPIKMLFVGTMTWAPNNEGIIWFLKNVMPLCKDRNTYDLTIVGKNPSEDVKDLAAGYENVHILGYVDKLEDIYDSTDVLVVPLFVGSGQRVKIIEAFARNFAIISTTIGAEGLKYTDNESILIANTAEEFKSAIDRCKNIELLKRIASGGKEEYESFYSTEVVARELNCIIGEK